MVDCGVVVLPSAKDEWDHTFILLNQVISHAFDSFAKVTKTGWRWGALPYVFSDFLQLKISEMPQARLSVIIE